MSGVFSLPPPLYDFKRWTGTKLFFLSSWPNLMPYRFSFQSSLNDIMKPLKTSEFSDIPGGIPTGQKFRIKFACAKLLGKFSCYNNRRCVIVVKNMARTAFFCVITQRVAVIPYPCFGTTYLSHLQGSKIQEKSR